MKTEAKGLILDLGCGHGGWEGFLTKRNSYVVGLDISREGLLKAREPFPRTQFLCADACQLPFRHQVFDVVFAGYVLHHLRFLEHTLNEARRVLKKGGKLYSIDPNALHPLSRLGAKIRPKSKLLRFFLGNFSDSGEGPLYPYELLETVKKTGFINVSVKLFRSLPSSLLQRFPCLMRMDTMIGKIAHLSGNIFLEAERSADVESDSERWQRSKA
jgi:ubiquinone/menaquinone biosynthesis C-methylase UbiE